MTAAPNWRAVMAAATTNTATRAVANYATLECMTSQLPAPYIARLMRALNDHLSFSYGWNQINDGLGLVEADLRAETLRNDEPGVRHGAAL